MPEGRDQYEAVVERLHAASRPEEIFGKLDGAATTSDQLGALTTEFRKLARIVHPDYHAGHQDAAAAFCLLEKLRERAIREIEDGTYGHVVAATVQPVTVRSPTRVYEGVVPFRAGDCCDCYLGEFTEGREPRSVVLKIVREQHDTDLVEHEARILAYLWSVNDPQRDHFTRYLAQLIETLRLTVNGKVRRANVLANAKGFISLEEVAAAYPNGLDVRDVAWMWRRVLEGLAWVHRQGVVHGAVIPPHVLVQLDGADGTKRGHGGMLIDWSYAVRSGSGARVTAMSTSHTAYYPPEVERKLPATPALDCFMVAKCVVRLLGGDVTTGKVPSVVPTPIQRFLKACLIANPHRRYGDAWECYTELNRILQTLYGPARYRRLHIPT